MAIKVTNKIKTIVNTTGQAKTLKGWNTANIKPVVKQTKTKDIAAKIHNEATKNMHVHNRTNPIVVSTGKGSYKQ